MKLTPIAAALALTGLAPEADAVSVVTNFNNFAFNNNALNSIGNSYTSADNFRFNASGLFAYGSRHAYYMDSGAIFAASSGVITTNYVVNNVNQPFNVYAATLGERTVGAGGNFSVTGIRADGTTITVPIALDGGAVSAQTFYFTGLTNIVTLRFNGGYQVDSLTTSNLIAPPPSDADVHFDGASIGTVGASYNENNYTMTTTAAGGMNVRLTTNDSYGLAVAGTGTIDLSAANAPFALNGFTIEGNGTLAGTFRLAVTDENGIIHTSSALSSGIYNQNALLQMFGGDDVFLNILNANFVNTTGQGVTLDNLYTTIPEIPASGLAVAGLAAAALRRRRTPS